MNYDPQYTGKYYQMVDGITYTKNIYNKWAGTQVVTGKNVLVQLTGYYELNNNNPLYQETNGEFVDLRDGWQYAGYSTLRQYSPRNAQNCVDKIIKNNASIYENNLVCARFSYKLTSEEQAYLFDLQQRVRSRNNKLLNDGLCTNQRVSSPPGYMYLENYLNEFMNGESISGVVTTLVVSAIVVASLATAAYFAYKFLADQSEDDVKFSNELTSILMDRLTPEEYQALLNETKGIVTKNKLKAKISGGLSLVKWGLIGIGCFAIYKVVSNKIKERNV